MSCLTVEYAKKYKLYRITLVLPSTLELVCKTYSDAVITTVGVDINGLLVEFGQYILEDKKGKLNKTENLCLHR